MENGNIENLFEEENSSEEQVSNVFADLPPVAPVDYEEQVEKETEVMEENSSEEQVSNVFADMPENNVEPIVEQNVFEEIKTASIESTETTSEILNKEVLEHPDAKITLKKEEEEVIDKSEIEELKNVKLSDNSSLRFVLILGIILLVIIFLIPYVSKYI